MKTPEQLMKEGFLHLELTRKCFKQAKQLYEERSKTETDTDHFNGVNVNYALKLLAYAYDQVSEINENDLN